MTKCIKVGSKYCLMLLTKTLKKLSKRFKSSPTCDILTNLVALSNGVIPKCTIMHDT